METATAFNIAITRKTDSRISELDLQNIPFGKIYADHMFVADYEDGTWQNLSIVPFGDLGLSPATSSLHYGQSIFEGLKAFRGPDGKSVLIFRPDENAKRLNRSAKRICMPQIPEELFLKGLKELIDIDREWAPIGATASLYIRPFMFATDEYIGLKPSQKYRFIIFTGPVGSYYSEPVKVKIETHFTRAPRGGTGAAKVAGNYAGAMYPARLAQEQGYHQLIWTDGAEHRYIEEAGTMNILFVMDGKLISIPDSDSILPGITRKSLLTIAKDWGMEVEERPLEVAELVSALKEKRITEAFGAGTAATVAHISLIGHEGVNYELPPIEAREVSNKLKKELQGIQRGLIADRHSWVKKV